MTSSMVFTMKYLVSIVTLLALFLQRTVRQVCFHQHCRNTCYSVRLAVPGCSITRRWEFSISAVLPWNQHFCTVMCCMSVLKRFLGGKCQPSPAHPYSLDSWRFSRFLCTMELGCQIGSLKLFSSLLFVARGEHKIQYSKDCRQQSRVYN